MSQFTILLQKEWRENLRNYKVFWIPAIFVLFGALEPVTNYFLPQILDSVGNLPDGAVINIPQPAPAQILVAVLGQYQLVGLLVLVLAYMGSIAGERKSGTATLLYVRPLSFVSYFLSKWLMAALIALISVWLGLLTAYYYTVLLFGAVKVVEFLQFGATYSLWILLVVSIVLAASAVMPSPGLAATISLAVIFLAQLTDGLLGAYWIMSPVKIPQYAAQWLTDEPVQPEFWWASGIVLLLIASSAAAGVWMSRKNVARSKV